MPVPPKGQQQTGNLRMGSTPDQPKGVQRQDREFLPSFVGERDMTPERVNSLAAQIRFDYALSRGAFEAIIAALLQACAEERADLLKNEFICAKCGLRKDSEHEVTHDF